MLDGSLVCTWQVTSGAGAGWLASFFLTSLPQGQGQPCSFVPVADPGLPSPRPHAASALARHATSVPGLLVRGRILVGSPPCIPDTDPSRGQSASPRGPASEEQGLKGSASLTASQPGQHPTALSAKFASDSIGGQPEINIFAIILTSVPTLPSCPVTRLPQRARNSLHGPLLGRRRIRPPSPAPAVCPPARSLMSSWAVTAFLRTLPWEAGDPLGGPPASCPSHLSSWGGSTVPSPTPHNLPSNTHGDRRGRSVE